MNKGLEALKELVSHIELEMNSDSYYKCKNAKEIIEKELKEKEWEHNLIKEYLGVEFIDIINAIREGIYFNDTTRCGTKEVYGEISSIQWFNDKWCFYIPRFATYIPIKEKDTCWWLSKKNMTY